MYEFKMALLGNGKPEEFLLFQSNSQVILKASVNIMAVEKINQSLCEFEIICGNIGNSANPHIKQIILVLGTYIFSSSALTKQKCVMHREISNPLN